MRETGIVRRIDELGRVVIPKEIRKTQRIRTGDSLEIYTDGNGGVIFKKYSPLAELGEPAAVYADVLACALREVREETGLTMHAPVYRGIVDFFCDPWPAERMHLYTCTDFSGVMTDCDEGCLEWVDKAAVQDLPIWQGDKIFFKLLAEDAPFFHLELTYDGDVLVKAVLDGVSLAL